MVFEPLSILVNAADYTRALYTTTNARRISGCEIGRLRVARRGKRAYSILARTLRGAQIDNLLTLVYRLGKDLQVSWQQLGVKAILQACLLFIRVGCNINT